MTLGWVAAGLGAGAAMADTRVALVIGNGEYRHARVLPNPRNDAEAIAAVLRQIGFKAEDVLLKLDLDYKAMRNEVRAFASKATAADVAIVYYAGHGIEVGGDNYLVPIDAKLTRDRDLEYEAVTLASVLDSVSEARKLKLVILDACRDNPLAHKIALKSGVTRKVVRGLQTIEPQGDVLVAYAAKAGTVALDGTGKHSPFAEALLKHMPTPGIDVFRMFGKVTETVLDATKRQQEPWLYGRAGGEAIALVPEEPKAPPKAPMAGLMPEDPKAPATDLQLPPPPPPHPDKHSANALSATESARICREVAEIASLSVLRALSDQHKGTTAGPCIAARIDELAKAEKSAADKAVAAKAASEKVAAEKAALEQKAPSEAKQAAPALKASEPPPLALKAPEATPTSYIPATECDRLAAAPGYAPAGVPGVQQEQIDAGRAINACREAILRYPDEARFQAWLGRGLKKLTNYGDARIAFEKAAGKGEVTSMTNLGWLFQNGKGVSQGYAQARIWYEKAAEKGEPIGMLNLAMIYRDGQGVPQDYAKAREWFEKAAEKGNLQAMNTAGLLAYAGKGGPTDYTKARAWFEKAAEKGDALATFNIGVSYRDGKGVPQDYASARVWFEKAAERGYVSAMLDLATIYQDGLGLPQSYASTRDWLDKAVQKGSVEAMNRMGILHHRGLGVMQSYEAARGWYERAMAKGSATGMYNLAILYNAGLGVAKNPRTAATYILSSARWAGPTARKDLDEEMRTWSPDTRRAVQELLTAAGDYRGSATGVWDQASRDAAKAYYSRRS